MPRQFWVDIAGIGPSKLEKFERIQMKEKEGERARKEGKENGQSTL